MTSTPPRGQRSDVQAEASAIRSGSLGRRRASCDRVGCARRADGVQEPRGRVTAGAETGSRHGSPTAADRSRAPSAMCGVRLVGVDSHAAAAEREELREPSRATASTRATVRGAGARRREGDARYFADEAVGVATTWVDASGVEAGARGRGRAGPRGATDAAPQQLGEEPSRAAASSASRPRNAVLGA